MVQWKAYTTVNDLGNGTTIQTVYVQTENASLMQAQMAFKALYKNDVWNIQKVDTLKQNTTNNNLDSNIMSVVGLYIMIIWMVIVFFIAIRI
jgi:hypothetical protein